MPREGVGGVLFCICYFNIRRAGWMSDQLKDEHDMLSFQIFLLAVQKSSRPNQDEILLT